MKNLIHVLLFFLVGGVLLTGCKDDPVVTDTDFEILTGYMATNDLDLADYLSGWVSTGTGINLNEADFSVPDYYIMDFRGADDFNAGHIKDAHNVSLGNVLTAAPDAAGKKILAVCYTGQTAARATGALRMMGYEAYSLKWGMCGWHNDLAGKWNANATNTTSTNWVTTGEPPAYGNFADPAFETGETDGEKILEARVAQALTNSGWNIGRTDVLDNPSDYFILNKWPLDSWNEFGHILGANRIDEDLNIEGLQYVDPNETVVVYCYTGQTSAITGIWMEVLGYDAKSLLYGANGMAYSAMFSSTVGAANKKSWRGEGSGSELNYGYYDSDNNFIGPQ